MKVSEFLKNAQTPFGVNENLANLEIYMDQDVCPISLYPWIREVGKEVFEQLSTKYEDFSQKATKPLCLKVFRALPPEFFSIQFGLAD